MTKLSDLHYVLLAIAAKRSTGSILPPSNSVGVTHAALKRSIDVLIKRGLAEEVESDEQTSFWRNDGERRLAVVITQAGRVAVAQADGQEVEASRATQAEPTPRSTPECAKPRTKQSLLIAMLNCAEGATLVELAEATGWLPHTTRAALTGLRKKGHVITASKMDGVSRYRARPAA